MVGGHELSSGWVFCFLGGFMVHSCLHPRDSPRMFQNWTPDDQIWELRVGGDGNQETKQRPRDLDSSLLLSFINYINLGPCAPLPGAEVIGSLEPGHDPVLRTCPRMSGDHLGSGSRCPDQRNRGAGQKPNLATPHPTPPFFFFFFA